MEDSIARNLCSSFMCLKLSWAEAFQQTFNSFLNNSKAFLFQAIRSDFNFLAKTFVSLKSLKFAVAEMHATGRVCHFLVNFLFIRRD